MRPNQKPFRIIDQLGGPGDLAAEQRAIDDRYIEALAYGRLMVRHATEHRSQVAHRYYAISREGQAGGGWIDRETACLEHPEARFAEAAEETDTGPVVVAEAA